MSSTLSVRTSRSFPLVANAWELVTHSAGKALTIFRTLAKAAIFGVGLAT